MRVFNSFDNLPKFEKSVVTLGSFDGIHCGHLSLLDRVKQIAAQSGGESIVMTFEPHPRVVLGRAEGLRLLTCTEEKILLLERYGIDNLIIIPFDRAFSRLSHNEFVEKYLVNLLSISSLVVGYNHHFGRDNEGGYSNLTKMGETYNFDVSRVDEMKDDDSLNVSSTVVRRLIASGDIERANAILRRPYLIMGKVDGDGRMWVPDALKLLPPSGKYSAIVNGDKFVITVDQNGVLWCEESGQNIVIEVVKLIG